MRLFKVTGEWKESAPPHPVECAIHITQGEEGPGLYVDEYFIPVSKALASPFEQQVPLTSLPLPLANLNEGEPCRLFQASRDELERLKEGRYYGKALAHICLPKLDGVPVRYFCSTWEDLVIPYATCPRVDRKYHGFDQVVGVRTIIESEDGEERLVEMTPGSSFRLHRDEHLVPPGESPVLVVSWNGKTPRVFRPTKFKEDRWHSRPPPHRHRPRRFKGADATQ